MSLDVYLQIERMENVQVHHSNITHNLNVMAKEAGIYLHLWRPEELGIKTAAQLIAPLEEGLAELKSDRKYFEKFNPENGWGNYDVLVSFVENYLEACKRNPEAKIETWR